MIDPAYRNLPPQQARRLAEAHRNIAAGRNPATGRWCCELHRLHLELEHETNERSERTNE